MEDKLREVLSSNQYTTFTSGQYTSFPNEMASIHVKDYDLMFANDLQGQQQVQPFLVYKENSVAFIKLYLMPFSQFEALVCLSTDCQAFLLPESINKDSSFPLFFDQSPPPLLNSVAKIGTLEHLDILCMTHTQHTETPQVQLQTPSPSVVRRLFKALRHAFFNYSEHFILLYLYKREQVRFGYTSVKELMEVVFESQEEGKQEEIMPIKYEEQKVIQVATTQLDEEQDRTLRCTTCIMHDHSSLIQSNALFSQKLGIKNHHHNKEFDQKNQLLSDLFNLDALQPKGDEGLLEQKQSSKPNLLQPADKSALLKQLKYSSKNPNNNKRLLTNTSSSSQNTSMLSGRTGGFAFGGKINGFLHNGNETANTEFSEISGVMLVGGKTEQPQYVLTQTSIVQNQQ
ncbi:hypothetical protein FGO68_gene1014 [Halteria grandinella]|uniref:Uncharacterized protein n=1 Tax=Halteria grandinella TaxID=5974 RepID=A0A8J8NE13_HALGN|nr:hypothetical protein FGO68_gene1014 [Halteria grandinella]